jgi:hypothetical protein
MHTVNLTVFILSLCTSNSLSCQTYEAFTFSTSTLQYTKLALFTYTGYSLPYVPVESSVVLLKTLSQAGIQLLETLVLICMIYMT